MQHMLRTQGKPAEPFVQQSPAALYGAGTGPPCQPGAPVRTVIIPSTFPLCVRHYVQAVSMFNLALELPGNGAYRLPGSPREYRWAMGPHRECRVAWRDLLDMYMHVDRGPWLMV